MAKQPRPLTGKVVAITGGARGIGRATAAALLRKGAKVAIGDLDLAVTEQTAAALGGGVVALQLDVTDAGSFDRFVAETERQLGPLDVLVNNAGIMLVGPFSEETADGAQAQVDINLLGVITGSKLALTRFLPRRTGHLVNVASTAGKAGIPGGATYSATKFAVVGLTEAIRGEVRGTGIETSVVMPVPVRTELAAGLQKGRGVGLVEPEDVADAIVDALEFPRHDVFVPRQIGRITRIGALLPRKWTEAVGRAMRTDHVLGGADRTARAAYEQRAKANDTATSGRPAKESEEPASAEVSA
ncbi:MAG TPA: SDR family oxidoreductase [Conexibacter sp.]|nr:SDR family oxidoreductase [Conexibacter sp.]